MLSPILVTRIVKYAPKYSQIILRLPQNIKRPESLPPRSKRRLLFTRKAEGAPIPPQSPHHRLRARKEAIAGV